MTCKRWLDLACVGTIFGGLTTNAKARMPEMLAKRAENGIFAHSGTHLFGECFWASTTEELPMTYNDICVFSRTIFLNLLKVTQSILD